MRRQATDTQDSVQDCVPYPSLPADHVLYSGAVLFPGAFDPHGCPLFVFPVDGHARLPELSKGEVVDFIKYFHCLYKKQHHRDTLLSVVADLSNACLFTANFIADILLLLENAKRTVNTVYMVQPKRKEVVRSLQKILLPQTHCTFKEIDTFVQEFISVVKRMPLCIASMRALCRLPLPTTFRDLHQFCSFNEAKFHQLRSDLRLDDLLRHCGRLVVKLQHPEKEPHYHAMVGTAVFTHTTRDMLQNFQRLTAAADVVDQLWQQAFSHPRHLLKVFQLREEAQLIMEKIECLLQNTLPSYKVEIAKDAAMAGKLVTEFKTSVHAPAMDLVCCAEDVMQTLAEMLPLDSDRREPWILDLERRKEKLHFSVQYILQTLRAVSCYYRHYHNAQNWYSRVLSENILQELLSDMEVDEMSMRRQRNYETIPAWKWKLSLFLKKNPPPHLEALLHLAHLSKMVPDDELQQAGKQISQRCMTLRELLVSSSPVSVGHLRLALKWQYELLQHRHVRKFSESQTTNITSEHVQDVNYHQVKETDVLRASPPTAFSRIVSAESNHGSFDSGSVGAEINKHTCRGREGLGLFDSFCSRNSAALSWLETHKTDQAHKKDFNSVGNSKMAGIQIHPKTMEAHNFELKVNHTAALSNNLYLNLAGDDVEDSVSIPKNSKREFSSPSDPGITSKQSNMCRDQPTQTEILSSTQPKRTQPCNWNVGSQVSLGDPQLSPICKVLSSTITDGRDQSFCTMEGIQTLLWDSYDLHQGSINSGIDVSIKDCRMKEHKGLELEKTDQPPEILEEEDEVLALIMLEDRPVWDNEMHFCLMSSTHLVEDAFLGLEDCVDHAELLNLSSSRLSASEVDSKASIGGRFTETTVVAEGTFYRPNLMTESRVVQVTQDLIMQDKVNVHETGFCNEKQRRTREDFWKREAENNFDMSLDPECKEKIKRRTLKSHWRVTDSNQAVCDKLSAGLCHRSWRSHSAAVLEDVGKTEIAQTDSSMEGKTGMQDMDQRSKCESPYCRQPSTNMMVYPMVCVSAENDAIDQQQCFLMLRTRSDCAFDPGGASHLHVPQSWRANLSKHDTHSFEMISSPQSAVAKHLLPLQRNSFLSVSEENPGHALRENGKVWLDCSNSSDMSHKEDAVLVVPLQIWPNTFWNMCVDVEHQPVLLTLVGRFNVCYTAVQAVLTLELQRHHGFPTIEGYVLPHAVHHFHTSHVTVTVRLKKKEDGCMCTSAQMETERNMERTCCAALKSHVLAQRGLPYCWIIPVTTEQFR
ncbi:uncharacterized protein si:ch211-241j12.4 isoform X2 [Dunckerocampus dactyliophorus]|uniref:uncharacterized protein si:ch211-241j12.4 isoform X2 n=1 Tax=Dunckerocampus dactyliophorus TaxID=161453 RepID=UPI0024077108|nr:uncharacterized protein si:ch211-241j12.4 isoform X2 [Dunckerocampus dactyliophorus]